MKPNKFSINVYFISFFCLLQVFPTTAQGDKKLESFGLEEVSLLEGPFKNAQKVDINYILELEADRLLVPFRREAGLEVDVET